MRSEIGYADSRTACLDDFEDAARRHAISCDHATLVDGAENETVVDLGCSKPCVDGMLGPTWHGHCADPAAFANQVQDRPASVPQLNVFSR